MGAIPWKRWGGGGAARGNQQEKKDRPLKETRIYSRKEQEGERRGEKRMVGCFVKACGQKDLHIQSGQGRRLSMQGSVGGTGPGAGKRGLPILSTGALRAFARVLLGL